VAVTSEFLKDGNVFIEQDAEGRRTEVPVQPGGHAVDIPLVVLIDEGTASSGEILAGAIQDHGRGKLVGTRTFGTGTVLQPFPLSDGSAVLLAVTEWLTPNGRQIWHTGISPDVEVALPEGVSILLPETETDLDADALAKSEDAQLLKALSLLKEQIR
jgi:carboxyl-terminal processing protease